MELTKENLIVIIASLQLIGERIEQMMRKASILQDFFEELLDSTEDSGPSISTADLSSVKQMLRDSDILDLF